MCNRSAALGLFPRFKSTLVHFHLFNRSAGSVPPSDLHRCVRNVIFRDSTFKFPIKLIHIKTNPPDPSRFGNQTAVIENVVYENLTATDALLWPLYVGPQQQKEPDGAGEGVYDNPTEPRVTIRNISFIDITSKRSKIRAGVLRCNASNPCREFNFKNVKIEGALSSFDGGFICDGKETVTGSFDNHSVPSPSRCVS